jgi:hypothetical protein
MDLLEVMQRMDSGGLQHKDLSVNKAVQLRTD